MFMQKKCANKAGYNSINDLPISIQKEVNIKSGKLALQKREAALSLGISFGIETTASSNATSRLIDKAHNANYLVKMVYVMLSNVNLHLQRVSIRVKTGGHYVSPEDIRRRFERAEKIFPQLMKKADQVTVYDNTDGYQLVLVKEKGRYRIFPCREEVRIRLETALKEIQTEKTNITNRNNCDIER